MSNFPFQPRLHALLPRDPASAQQPQVLPQLPNASRLASALQDGVQACHDAARWSHRGGYGRREQEQRRGRRQPQPPAPAELRVPACLDAEPAAPRQEEDAAGGHLAAAALITIQNVSRDTNFSFSW